MKLTGEQRKKAGIITSGIWWETIISAMLFTALLLFVICFIDREHFIYFWDSANYWSMYQYFNVLFAESPLAALGEVIVSVRYEEYNLFPVVLLLPAGLLLGDSRLSYVLGNTVLFCLPAIIFFAYFFKTRISEEPKLNSCRFGFIIAVLWFGGAPQLWVPVLYGYLDSGGLLLAIGVLMIYCRKSLRDQSYFSILSIALLLSLMVVFRRWYAYWVVGFLAGVTIVNITILVREYRTNYRKYLPTVGRLFMLGSLSLALFIFFATPQAIKMLTTNYADIYSGFKSTTSFLGVLQDLYGHFGLLILASAAFGFFLSVKSAKLKSIALVLFLQFWFSLIVFTNTQDMNNHHFYILFPSLFFFSCYSWVVLLACVKGKRSEVLCWFTMFFLLLIHFSIVLSPPVATALQKIDFVLPKLRHVPMNRQDIEEIDNILKYINERNVSGVDKVYVLASSSVLNDAILRNECSALTGKSPICNNFVTTAHVDKRDGVPLRFFKSKYIITSTPAQFHLNKKDQQVIEILRDMVVKREGFGRNYKKLEAEFILDGNTRVLIYQRLNEKFDENDLREISDIFVKMYPRHKRKFLFSQEAFDNITE